MKFDREQQQLKVAEKFLQALMKLPQQQLTPQTIIDACKGAHIWLLAIEEYPNES